MKEIIEDKDKRIKMGISGREIFLERYGLDQFELNMQNVFNEI